MIGEKSEYNIIEKYNIIDQEKRAANRGPASFYMSRDLAQNWRRWCDLNGQKDYILIEDALLTYMQSHPIPQVTLSVTKDLAAYAPNVKERLQNKIIREKIAAVIAIIRRHQKDRVEWRTQRTQLQKLVMQATKLRKPDQDLLDLLRQAEELV